MMEHELLNGHESDLDEPELEEIVAENGEIAVGIEIANGVSVDSVDHSNRIKKKAKRLIKQLSKEIVPNANGAAIVPGRSMLKNSRRPRNGYGRGLPKKGNAMFFMISV